MKKLTLSKKEGLNCYFYLIPGGILMILFVVVPVVYSLYMSFFHIKSIGAEWEFVGLKNYLSVAKTDRWLQALGRTVLYGAWGILVGQVSTIILSFFVAKHKLLNVLRYIFYLPCVVSAVTIGRLWNYMLTPDEYGFFNSILLNLKIISEPINFLGDQKILVFVVLFTSLYGAGGGMGLVLYTTQINNVSRSVIEAAMLDGASSLKIFLKIELPELKPLITANVILGVVGAFKSFEGLYALVPNATATETIGVLLYNESLHSSEGYGLASAMGVVLTLIVMAIMIVYMYFPTKNKADEQ